MNIKASKVCIATTVTEHLNDYALIIKRYFKNISHHMTLDHFMNKDAILIYSFFPMALDCSGCHQKSLKFNIPRVNGNVLPSSFFEDKFRNIPCQNVHHILYDNSLIGVYCKKNNLFMTTDIAHEGGNEEHVEQIFDFMEDIGLIKRASYDIENRREIFLGADPETESSINGKIIASNMLPIFSTKDKSYLSHDGHHSPQRELRPDPSKDPQELVENLRDLIKISSFLGEDLTVWGNNIPLGGHIHIGGIGPSKEIIMILDYFLDPLNNFNTSVRKSSKYGKKGDFRPQPHGFEYRTPPSVWLLTPKLALMTLQLTKVAVETLINGTDIEIGEKFNYLEYKKNLKLLGFSEEWVDSFFNELKFAEENIKQPLAKLWDVEVPREHKIKKRYSSKFEQSLIPTREERIIENLDEPNDDGPHGDE